MKQLSAFRFSLLYILLFTPLLMMAQAPGFDQDTNDVPIDGGLSLLLAAGIGYGMKRNYKHTHDVQKNKPAAKD